ncbi:MAG: MarR family transcriptional regulator [bacterium]|nr:MarR family transcriptional regulator [bacterium]
MSKKKTFRDQKDQPGPGLLLARAARKWSRALDASLGELDLSPTLHALLDGIERLSSDGEPITQTRLARATHLDVMLASKALRTLEERGLIEREDHPGDTRAKDLGLTKEGIAVLKRAHKIVGKLEDEMFTQAGFTDKHRKTISSLLD